MNLKGWVVLVLFTMISMVIAGLVLPVLPISMGITVITMVWIMIAIVILLVIFLGLIRELGNMKY